MFIKIRKKSTPKPKIQNKSLIIDKSFIANNNLNHQYNIRNQISDIFLQKNINKSEFEIRCKTTHKKNISSYNILLWDKIQPHLNPEIKIKDSLNYKSQILNSKKLNNNNSHTHLSFYEKLFSEEPSISFSKTINSSINIKSKKDSIILGDYEGEEYKIKKNKTIKNIPKKLLGDDKTPYERKMYQIFGESGNYNKKNNSNKKPALIRKRLSSSFNTSHLEKEFTTNNDHDPKITNNCKEMRYYFFYGNKGIENAKKKLDSLSVNSSTNNLYQEKQTPKQNKINSLKSNIFNSENIEKINNINENNNENKDFHYITVKRKKSYLREKRTKSLSNIYFNSTINNNETISNNTSTIFSNYSQFGKKFFYESSEILPENLDMYDPKTNLYFSKDKSNYNKNPREKKFINLYGTIPKIPKKKSGQEFQYDNRAEIDSIVKKKYQNMKISKIKKISENISQLQNTEFINDINNKSINKNNKGLCYEIKTNLKNKFLDTKLIEKKFAEKGLHIYDMKENIESIMGNKGNKFAFKIRENASDNNFDKKINEIKKDLYKSQGFVIQEKKQIKRTKTDLLPNSVKWYNPNSNMLTKNINAEKTGQDKIHSKPIIKNNNEQKITKIRVNLKYKNKIFNF